MPTHLVDNHAGITLGILAGGRASRLGGRDKAWLERNGVPQVLALVQALESQVDAILISANRNAERYLSRGLRAIHDRTADLGPLGGLEALAAECRSAWLLTLPVDALLVPDDLIAKLTTAASGAFAVDDDGAQPLAALWRTAALRAGVSAAIASSDRAVHTLQTRLGMARVRFDGVRFGNLNTPDDLVAAGIDG
ncbi:MAG: molybdenum cofactor guanylyltransferase [Luteimonas sp.]